MSELKGTLLSIILALGVFALVYGIVNGVVKDKAEAIEDQLRETEPKTPASVSALTYTNID